ncbi:Transcriptional regulator, DeoR family [Devosia sp. DBB001]|nr:Transcriptional regulator, DeoR family [Devosia sp. DBB001]
MYEFLPPYVRTGAIVSDEVDERGWRKVTLCVGSVQHAALEILRFGTHAEVLNPPELRAELAGIARMLADAYAQR